MADEPKRIKCEITPDKLELCWIMREVIEGPYGRGTKYQGVKVHHMVNMKTHEWSRDLIVLKSGQHSKKGVVLNFCPFCKGELVEGAAARLEEK